MVGNASLLRLIRNRRGNAVVEFALIFPLLLVILFGITEFGRAWMTMNVLNTAAREAARLAVVTGPDVPAATAKAQEVCQAAGITPNVVTVTGPEPDDPERRVTVTIQADFQVLSGNLLGTFSGTIPLSTSSIMRHESF